MHPGQVHLTLAVGPLLPMLQALCCEADAVCLRGPPPTVPLDTLKALARHCRVGTTLHADCGIEPLQAALVQTGFVPQVTPANPGFARYAPHWPLKRSRPQATPPGEALVLGAGLSGAAVANALAERGWQVRVLDHAPHPAAGASSLPVGLMVPHVSPDDAPLSRVSRAGLRCTLDAARRLLRQGEDWLPTPVLDVGAVAMGPRYPASWHQQEADDWLQSTDAGLHHAQAAWVKPHALVHAWLAHPSIRFTGNATVARLSRGEGSGDWCLWDAADQSLGRAPLVVVCTAYAARQLLPGAGALPLDAVAGQVALGSDAGLGACIPCPLHGHGHLVPGVPGVPGGEGAGGAFWLSGSTYERQAVDQLNTASGLQHNAERLATLLAPWPAAAHSVARQFAQGSVRQWAAQRCTSLDRLPLAGEWQPGLHLSVAMGSRGLSFAALCGELLAAQINAEPLALDARLVQALSATRFQR
jgi:tRNA 5-methylaminomethyl-2-thiouridine biosynthesis bifunctional protein